jgi:hypothetical protein
MSFTVAANACMGKVTVKPRVSATRVKSARVPAVAVRAFVRVTHFFKKSDPCVGDWCEESFDDPCVGDWCEGALDDPCVGDWCPEGFEAKKADPCVGDWCPESFVE